MARRGDEIEAVAAQIRADGGEALAVTTDVTDDAAVECSPAASWITGETLRVGGGAKPR